MIRGVVVSILLSLTTAVSYAQFEASANIQTNHLWRGGEVADGVVVTTDVATTLLGENFRLGVWGGMNTQGSYKEFNYYATYTLGGLSLALWDTYNFSDFATYNNEEFFNYDAATTGRFLDATVAYCFGETFPLKLSWSTVIFGRDRISDNSANRYSTFCYAEYPLYNRDLWRLDVGLGGAFAINPCGESANFYGEQSGVVHVSMAISRDLVLGDYHIPITVTTMWNPQSDQAYLQLAARLFSF